LVAVPGLTGSVPRPAQSAATGHPVSGCRGVRVLALDGADRGRRRQQRGDAVLRAHPPERPCVGAADRLAVVEIGRRRAVHDVRVTDDLIDHFSATACPPLSRTMPFVRPVVPDV
jgi:hypothetical protein